MHASREARNSEIFVRGHGTASTLAVQAAARDVEPHSRIQDVGIDSWAQSAALAPSDARAQP